MLLARISFVALMFVALASAQTQPPTPVPDTNQRRCYDTQGVIPFPAPNTPFAGQDAQHVTTVPAFRDNQDGTVTDLVTGLIWQKTPDFAKRRTYDEAKVYAEQLVLAQQSDWRLPTIKELYSLIDFRGSSVATPARPYIDTRCFDFEYPPPSSGLRPIDAQYWSSTEYLGTTMNNDPTVFGVNFADGRIKGYPRLPFFARYVRCVRGRKDYGSNRFVDNKDGTITDLSNGLTWQEDDSGKGLNWQDALAYAEKLELAGHKDWRLPNAKELQSIVDYSRAPLAQDPQRRGPAIDPIFGISQTESYFWTSTTLDETPIQLQRKEGVYVCFGRGLGWLEMPPNSNNWQLVDVHGAGAQRSDPKDGDPKQFPRGRGPQGDDVRIFNFVRCVRGGISSALRGDRYTLPVSTGGQVGLELDAGPAAAGRPYLVVSSASGTAPGLPLLPSPAVLPLVLDAFTSSALSVTNTLAFDRFAGIFDANGRAQARFDTLGPVASSLAGLELSFAFVTFNPVDFASNPVVVELTH
jgi:hypothetical protein